MNSNAWDGPFELIEVGSGVWRLSATAVPGVEITLLRALGRASMQSALGRIDRVGIEYCAEYCKVVVSRGDESWPLMVRSALVHEPRPDIYRELPLDAFGASARRFWRRVFLVVRLPGGRRLLRYLARRARA